jgi:hypothetical protein
VSRSILPLETPRLLLRLPETSDTEPFASRGETRRAGSINWTTRGYGLWTVVEKAGGQINGEFTE